MGFNAEILSIGNELLIGKTTNTNLTWISGRLAEIGGNVHSALTVRDEIDEIAAGLKVLLKSRPDLLLTNGGLGPTFDDKTLQGVSYALNICLKLDETAVAWIKKKVGELNPARLKMAHLPDGATPLQNRAGTAPGVHLRTGDTNVFILPGVPDEMKAIFRDSVDPFLHRNFMLQPLFEASLLIYGIPESILASYLDECMLMFPEVYVKSHPLGVEEGKSKLNLHMTSYHDKGRVESAAAALAKRIRVMGGRVKTP